MRTRIGPLSASVASRAAASASEARANATKNASPCVSTSTPRCRTKASRSTRLCSANVCAYASPSSCNNHVEPSMSVKRNVTVPVGSSRTGQLRVDGFLQRRCATRRSAALEVRALERPHRAGQQRIIGIPHRGRRPLRLRLDRPPDPAGAEDVAPQRIPPSGERERVEKPGAVVHLPGNAKRVVGASQSFARGAELEQRESHADQDVLLPPGKA